MPQDLPVLSISKQVTCASISVRQYSVSSVSAHRQIKDPLTPISDIWAFYMIMPKQGLRIPFYAIHFVDFLSPNFIRDSSLEQPENGVHKRVKKISTNPQEEWDL